MAAWDAVTQREQLLQHELVIRSEEIVRLTAAVELHNTERLAAERRVEALEEQRDGLIDRLHAADSLGGAMTAGLGRAAAERDQALAERAEAQKVAQFLKSAERQASRYRVDVEKLGATIAGLRAELAVMARRYQETRLERDCEYVELAAAEARITRVREMCDGIVERMGPYDRFVPPTAEDIFGILELLDGPIEEEPDDKVAW